MQKNVEIIAIDLKLKKLKIDIVVRSVGNSQSLSIYGIPQKNKIDMLLKRPNLDKSSLFIKNKSEDMAIIKII